MLQSARPRKSSVPPEIAGPETFSLLIDWQAAAIARKLETASPPKWKSRQKLYDEAMLERYGPGTYMGPLTPTPGYTPTPSPPPEDRQDGDQHNDVQTPPSSIVPPASLPSPPQHNHEQTPKTYRRTNPNERQKRIRHALSSPNANRVEKRSGRNSRRSMLTRSQCRGSCCGRVIRINKSAKVT